jgi:hypothetical protein
MKATALLLALAILAIAAGPALADPYRLHHDYYKLSAAKGAGAQSQTGLRVPVNPALTWLHRALTPPQAGAAGAQSQTGALHGSPWSSIGLGIAAAAVASLLLLAMLKLRRRAHTTAV